MFTLSEKHYKEDELKKQTLKLKASCLRTHWIFYQISINNNIMKISQVVFLAVKLKQK